MTKYSESFKEMIVDLANNGTKAKDLSSEYGISEAAIYKWKKLWHMYDMQEKGIYLE